MDIVLLLLWLIVVMYNCIGDFVGSVMLLMVMGLVVICGVIGVDGFSWMIFLMKILICLGLLCSMVCSCGLWVSLSSEKFIVVVMVFSFVSIRRWFKFKILILFNGFLLICICDKMFGFGFCWCLVIMVVRYLSSLCVVVILVLVGWGWFDMVMMVFF